MLGRSTTRVLLASVAAGITAHVLVALDPSGFVVVLGAGNAGVWQTEILIANASDAPSSAIVSRTPLELCPPPFACNLYAELSPQGSAATGAPNDGVSSVYVGSLDNLSTPVVAARAYSESGQSVDLPVLNVETVIEANADVIVFAGAQRHSGTRSNLVLANIEDPRLGNGFPVELAVAVLDENGGTVGSTTVTLDRWQFYFVSDLVGHLGVDDLQLGQIRVTRLGGVGFFAGVMTTVRPDGSVSSTVGAVPR